ncbi:MAG: hypothetical protein C5B48_05130 [Candidatus Rokuibacteriota bacterium]|nr:MAG: hypothetical protein C5B48_05130 [Candidatus Rokubacteria bacterium]
MNAETASRPLSAALSFLERLVATRRGALVLFLLGVGAHLFRSIAWPVGGGRDLDEYLLDYAQLLDRHPLLPWPMLFRTPATPVVAGLSLDLFGGVLVEPVMAVLYAASIVAWTRVALRFGRRAALVTAVALLLYQGYALMFHELSSEPVFAASFSLWALALVRAADRPSGGRFAVVGLVTALVVLVRPGNAVLLAFVVVPLVMGSTWRQRARYGGAFAAAALLPLAAWSVQNGLRFGDYTLARGGNAVVPFYRAFITDHIIQPQNGPASRRLARAMRTHLLTRQPYRGYGVTLDELFRRGSFRVHEDLYNLSDEVFGWSSAYSVLRDTGVEGIEAHPGTYARGVATTLWQELSRAQFRLGAPNGPAHGGVQSQPSEVVGGQRLPRPTEGEPIPGGQNAWISRPDSSIRQVWTSPTAYHFVFARPGERRRFDEIQRRLNRLFANLPRSRGNVSLSHRLNELSRWYPRPYQWVLVGLIALAVRRPRRWLLLCSFSLAGLLVVFLDALGLFADLHFLLPIAPAFVLLGVGGLLGTREARLS